MIDIKVIRENPKKIKEAAKAKGAIVDIEKLLVLDDERVKLIEQRDVLRSAKKASKKPSPEEIKEIVKAKDKLKKVESKLEQIEAQWKAIMLSIPNPALHDVKVGKDESENEVLRKEGAPTKLGFAPKDHLELAKDLIDMERGAKVSGSRFYFLKGKLAQLELALLNYSLNILTKEGFQFVIPPVLVNRASMEGMGYLEHGGEEEIYYFPKDEQYLVGTSEQSIGPMHRDEIIEESSLPLRYASFSTCFRREAGSYGKDTRGIFRVHQFNKLEMFVFSKPEDATKEHEFLLSLEERIVKGLGLPYQVIKMCTGDLGLPAAKKYDIETWLPTQQKYRETHSTSNCTDFQARRLNIKYRKPTGEKEYLYTLNGTALAFGRIIIMILENYQQEDGSIKIPEILHKYTGFKEIK